MRKKIIFSILMFLLFNTSYAKTVYFSAGFSTQASIESISFFSKKTGTILDKLMSSELVPTLRNFQANLFTQFKKFENSAYKLHGSFQKNLSFFVDMYNKKKDNGATNMNDSELNELGSLINSVGNLRTFLTKLRQLTNDGFFQKLGQSSGRLKEFVVDLENAARDAIGLKETFFRELGQFGIHSKEDLARLWNDINTPGTSLNDALRQKLSPLFSTGFQGYFQVGLPILRSDFYYGFELGFGFNLGRLIAPNLNLLKPTYDVNLGMGIMPRLFVKYDIYYLAATLFSGFGDRSLVVDPVYVGNLTGNNKVTSPFTVIETGLRLRLAFLNLESSLLFSINDFKYRDLRVGLGFEIPIII
ncbi:hypothetical protein [Borrelia persica]|uniref:hypothetical protein n=1 Tax=Borrelia persica TaxID=44448 RepID=UPI0004655A07|nr:hypothetical protein [Borrelia persica]